MRQLKVVLILLAVYLPVPAHSLRISISVGINDYGGYGDLERAVADAEAVASIMESIGDNSTLLTDATTYQFVEYLDVLTNNLSSEDTVVLFFSGHGVSLNGANSIVFADNQLLLVDDIIRAIKSSGVRTTVLILDACRDYPGPTPISRSSDTGATTRFSNSISGARGSFMIYSAGLGQYAFDSGGDGDNDPNSLFTRELIKLIPESGISIRELSLRLRENVEAVAALYGLRQTPAYYDELTGEFAFASPEPQLDRIDAPTAEQRSTPENVTNCEDQNASFNSIVTATTNSSSCN